MLLLAPLTKSHSRTIKTNRSQEKRKEITSSKNVLEYLNKSKAENFFSTLEELNGILQLIGARTKIKEFEKIIYIVPAFSKEDAEKEKAILKRRRERLNQSVPAEKLDIRSLEFFNDGKKEDVVPLTQVTDYNS